MKEIFEEPVADPMTTEKNIPIPEYIKKWKR
jgi:hypothetical protein